MYFPYEHFYRLSLYETRAESSAYRCDNELFRLHAALYCFQKLLEEIQDFEANKTYSYHQPVNVVRLFVDKVESIVRDLQSEAIPSSPKQFARNSSSRSRSILLHRRLYARKIFYLSSHME